MQEVKDFLNLWGYYVLAALVVILAVIIGIQIVDSIASANPQQVAQAIATMQPQATATTIPLPTLTPTPPPSHLLTAEAADPTLTMDCDIFFACAFPKGFKLTDYADQRTCTLNTAISWEGVTTVGCSLTTRGYLCYTFNGLTWSNGGLLGAGQITAESPSCGGRNAG